MNNRKRINGKYILLTLLAGFLYRVLIGLQGIDQVDMGASNTFYQTIFTHPEAMTYSFNYYLTGLAGGLWYQCFGSLGLLGFRLLEALVLTAAVFFVYKAFERLLPDTRTAVISILISFLFPCIVTTFHHFTLSFFFLSLAAWCYSKSLYSRSLPWTFLTGLVLGLSFFVRTGNMALLLLVLIPIVYGVSTRQRPLAVRLGGTMLGGMLTACILMVAIMLSLGHLDYFFRGLGAAVGYFGNSGILSAVGTLIVNYANDYINIILQLLAIVGLGALYIQSSRMTKRWATGLSIFLIIASVVLIATSQPYLSAIALYTLLCLPIFYAITPKEDKLIAAFVVLGTYILPFGTGSSIASIYHWTGALLIIPAAASLCHVSHILRRGALICSIYIACVMLWKALSFPYGEQQPRWLCTEQTGDAQLNTYTTAEEAAEYRHILPVIRQYTSQNPWLLMGNQASEVYYATESLPYLGTTLLDTFTGQDLLDRLDSQQQQYQRLPVVVYLKKSRFAEEEAAEVHPLLQQWMDTRHYSIAHDDDLLTVFLPR